MYVDINELPSIRIACVRSKKSSDSTLSETIASILTMMLIFLFEKKDIFPIYLNFDIYSKKTPITLRCLLFRQGKSLNTCCDHIGDL